MEFGQRYVLQHIMCIILLLPVDVYENFLSTRACNIVTIIDSPGKKQPILGFFKNYVERKDFHID